MKKRHAILRPGGILRWSTLCLLAGGAGLTSCDRRSTASSEAPSGGTPVVTERDLQVAGIQQRIEELDAGRDQLLKGDVPNNFRIEGVGYYHATAHDFYADPYNFSRDGQWFVNGAWQAEQGPLDIPASRPNEAALKKVDEALEKEQQLAQTVAGSGGGGNGSTVHHHHSSGFGFGNMLMMYWLLSGNRGMFSPGAGFQHASAQAPAWQGEMDRRRGEVSRHAAASPAYRRMVEESRTRGVPVSPGQSVRGGFGSNARSSTPGSSQGSGASSTGHAGDSSGDAHRSANRPSSPSAGHTNSPSSPSRTSRPSGGGRSFGG